MNVVIKWREVDWWFWPTTLVLIVIGLLGWPAGLAWAVLINGAQVIYFMVRERSVTAFPVQVRVMFFVLMALALLDPTRILFIALAVGSAMVTFLDRCLIARVLVHAPWNQDVELH